MKFIETIRIVDGSPCLLPLHIERMEATSLEVGYDAPPCVCATMLMPPPPLTHGVIKCRIVYGHEIESVEFSAYCPHPLSSLLITEAGDIDYHLKSADRTILDALHRKAVAMDCSDAIISRHGMITDTTYGNLVCHTVDGRMLTPDTPLMKGVMRRSLIESGALIPTPISRTDLLPNNHLDIISISIINVMLPLGAVHPIPLAKIKSPNTL